VVARRAVGLHAVAVRRPVGARQLTEADQAAAREPFGAAVEIRLALDGAEGATSVHRGTQPLVAVLEAEVPDEVVLAGLLDHALVDEVLLAARAPYLGLAAGREGDGQEPG